MSSRPQCLGGSKQNTLHRNNPQTGHSSRTRLPTSERRSRSGPGGWRPHRSAVLGGFQRQLLNDRLSLGHVARPSDLSDSTQCASKAATCPPHSTRHKPPLKTDTRSPVCGHHQSNEMLKQHQPTPPFHKSPVHCIPNSRLTAAETC